MNAGKVMVNDPVGSLLTSTTLLGQGNFVVIYSHVKQGEDDGEDDWVFFDLFRLKDGKILEHWDIQEKIGPKETWSNSGKF